MEIFHWNPRRPLFAGRIGNRIRVRSRVNNFGDLLGPIIVARILDQSGHDRTNCGRSGGKLLSVGSVLQFAEDGDIIWGTGRNGNNPVSQHRFSDLDVRAVRGPLTREFLMSTFGIQSPEVYGDPALLLPLLFPELLSISKAKTSEYAVVPNLHDIPRYSSHPAFISPLADVSSVIQAIARAEFVAGSSLHAIIVADALGIPCRLFRSDIENRLKYDDYFLGSGRDIQDVGDDYDSAVRMGPHQPLAWDPQPLLSSFPYECFR
ncbi:polysaccharide pyruvyl transferase family protein [Rhodococcus opacus]|uniref:polysaccharide pyruvyl transferase family protein n=1 Tax=Rhodococcus opacus TaxID=37919 RepID=UPI002952C837|nr:polysaccharide pyruvyl transferase family protein [Rhodococcus opacus]